MIALLTVLHDDGCAAKPLVTALKAWDWLTEWRRQVVAGAPGTRPELAGHLSRRTPGLACRLASATTWEGRLACPA